MDDGQDSPPLSVLLLEDSPLDADLTASYLERGGLRAAVRRVETRDAFVAALADRPDVILADYALPDFDGLGALELAKQACPDTPFIFVSGVLGEEVAIDTLRRGATDYVLKRGLERLVPSIHRALAEARERGERRRAEEQLRHQLRLTAVIAERAGDALFLTDARGHVTYLNPAAEKMFGWGLADLNGLRLHDVLHRHDGAECPLARVLADDRGVQNHEDVFSRRDGSAVPVRCSFAPVNPGEAATGAVLVVNDTSERIRLEEELRRQARELAEAARRKDEWLAMLAHELRNPLAPILYGLHLLRQKSGGDPTAERTHAMMTRQVQHVVRLVDDLLDVSRISRGKVELRRQSVDLVDVLRRAVEGARPRMEERRHAFEVSLPGGPVCLDGDPARLEQVFNNLLTNAAKYTDGGGRVRLCLESDGREAVVRVRDTGIGIRPEMLARVFEMFTQADRIDGQLHEGLGLGLSLVRSLTELHGGRVEALSDGPGRGSEFVVRLPLPAQVTPSADGSVLCEREHGKKEARPLRVLIVDDNRDSADLLAALLGFAGRHEVRVAYDGPTALEAAAEFRPQVVLIDIALPYGMDGYEVASRLQQRPGLGRPLLVALTGFGQAGDRQRSREAGLHGHLVKPVELKDLQELLARYDGP